MQNTPDIRHLEERLRLAMLAGNVDELDLLLDDELLFVGSEGVVYSKESDLELHRSGALKLAYLEWEELQLRPHDCDAWIVVATAFLIGKLNGLPFSGRFRYSRTWLRRDGQWRIASGSVAVIPPG